MKRTLVGSVAVFGLIAALAPAQAQVFNPETFTLKNGMKVVVIPNHRVPVVSHMVWYNVGSADEQPGKTGLAHLFEHLMFKGTKDVPPGEFSKIVARHGGRDNAFTSSDYTAYFQNVAKDKLPLVMKLEADRMVNLRLDEKNVATERDVVLEERRQRTDNNPAALLAERMNAALFVNHPYGSPVIGWASEVASLSREDAMAFYKKWYNPANATLIVSGDITAKELKPLAEQTYGKLKGTPLPPRERVAEPPPVGERRVVVRDEQVGQPSMSRAYLAPSANRGETAMNVPLQLLSEILGGGSTSRLYRALVVEQKLAAGAGSHYDADSYDLSTFNVYATPRPGVSLQQVEAALDEQVRTVAEQGVTADELERAKKRLVAAAVYARDSFHTGARVMGQALTTGQTVDDVENWPQRIKAVTVEQVAEAARHVLRPERSVTGHLLPVQSAQVQASARSPQPAVQAGSQPEVEPAIGPAAMEEDVH